MFFLNTGITTCNFLKGCQPETYNSSGTRTSSKEKDGTTTYYGSDGKTPTSRTYPDGGKINYDSNGNKTQTTYRDGGKVDYDSNGNPTTYTPPGGTPTPIPPGAKVC